VGTCCYMLLDYSKTSYYYKKAYDRFLEIGIIDSEFEDKLLYNLALCSSMMENYNDALMYIERLESIASVSKPGVFTNLILKANVFMKVNRTEEALNIYKEVLNNDIKYLYIVQNNIAVAFMNLGRLDESIEFFTKSINNQLQSLSPDTTISLIKLAEVYYKEKKYEEALNFYRYGLDNTIKFKQLDKLIQCYENIYKVCMEMSKISKFDFYYKSIEGLYDVLSFDEEQLKKMKLLEHNYISDINN
ncbi:MAG: MalT-like region, partial [Clostridiales bacterium]|nr:MalT-like region [Clostridiales bacterium]